jgi:hypothetical protein
VEPQSPQKKEGEKDGDKDKSPNGTDGSPNAGEGGDKTATDAGSPDGGPVCTEVMCTEVPADVTEKDKRKGSKKDKGRGKRQLMLLKKISERGRRRIRGEVRIREKARRKIRGGAL